MPDVNPEQSTDLAVHKLSLAVANLTEVVDGLRKEIGRSTILAEQIGTRCNQLESATRDLNRYLFTGNGQPALTQQLATIRTQLDSAMADMREFEQTRVSEHRLKNSEQMFTNKLEMVQVLLEAVQKSQEELEQHREHDREHREGSRTQFLVAIIGGALGIIGAAISAWAAFATK